jgi:hypothetical protein
MTCESFVQAVGHCDFGVISYSEGALEVKSVVALREVGRVQYDITVLEESPAPCSQAVTRGTGF